MNEEEQKYLDYTLESIEKELEVQEEQIKKIKKDSISLSYEDRQRGTHFQLNSQLFHHGKIINDLVMSKPSPYFGRFDFEADKKSIVDDGKYYIGKRGVSHNNKSIVKDWRTPICSLYYDSEKGKAYYESPSGIITGELKLKRQIDIKNGKLIHVQDSNLVSEDELLKPYLNVNADNKIKDIVASIQKEQNSIIRKPMDKNIIVQGVAGSGKTSVALHRVAYLIYNINSNNADRDFLVLGPNDYFLNYISSLLPDLDTTPVDQKTLLTFLNDYANLNLKFNNIKEKKNDSIKTNRKIEAFKSSLEYRNVIQEFLKKYYQNYLVLDGFKLNDEVIFDKDYVINLFSDGEVNYTRIAAILKNKFNNIKEELYEKMNKKYRAIYTTLPKGDPTRNEAIEKSNELHNLIFKDGTKLLTNYLKKLNKNALEVYKIFVANITDFNLPLSEKETLILQKNTLSSLQKKSINFEDIPALIDIQHKLTGNELDYKNIVIDEAQDYGLYHFRALRDIAKTSNFCIYGDLAQSIYSYKSIDSWDEVSSKIFDNNCEILNLSKSYRTTIEITDMANNVLTELKMKKANPVIRHGAKVKFQEINEDENFKYNKINEWILKGYKTIAIICKTEKEAEEVYKNIKSYGLDIKYLSNKDKDYKGGIFVLTSASAKGLEFDCTIINDASEKKYDSNSDVDLHLLYVASTRALHEQVILYNKNIVNVYKPFIDEIVEKSIRTR